MEEALVFVFCGGKNVIKFLIRIVIIFICMTPALFMARIGMAQGWLFTLDWSVQKVITLCLAGAGVFACERIGNWLDL